MSNPKESQIELWRQKDPDQRYQVMIEGPMEARQLNPNPVRRRQEAILLRSLAVNQIMDYFETHQEDFPSFSEKNTSIQELLGTVITTLTPAECIRLLESPLVQTVLDIGGAHFELIS